MECHQVLTSYVPTILKLEMVYAKMKTIGKFVQMMVKIAAWKKLTLRNAKNVNAIQPMCLILALMVIKLEMCAIHCDCWFKHIYSTKEWNWYI